MTPERCDGAIDGLARFVGAGVERGAPVAARCDATVVITGGSVAPARAALAMAPRCGRVIVVTPRSWSELQEALADDEFERLRMAPNIMLRPGTDILAVDGTESLEVIILRDRTTGAVDALAADHLYCVDDV